MEAARFDRFAEPIGQRADRRTLLRALLLGTLTGVCQQGATAKPKDKPPKD